MPALNFFARARLATSLPQTLRPIYSRQFTASAINMGVQKTLISAGNGVDKPKKGDSITMEYTGNLYDANAPGGKGKQFDSSVGRGDFKTNIGVGQLIKGTVHGYPAARKSYQR
jgi:FKBP-type peptidyl-prolyl cis-trans isomerase